MPYPSYTVTFKGDKVPRLANGDDRETPGPHTFVFSSGGGEVTVSLKHNDELRDKQPTLIITFS